MTAALVAFAADGYAFRESERACVRPVLRATLLAALAGARSERVAVALAAVAPARARLGASLIGRDEIVSPIDAAFVNAVAAAETSTLATPVVGAALAATEAAGAPGATVLDAIAAGLEVALRVERSLHGHVERGWDVRGTCGRLGAAIAAARAFGLSRAAMRNALGLAATAAGGVTGTSASFAEAFIAGAAAADGIEAALLARAEFTAAPAALDGRRGFAALMADALDVDALVAGLGTDFDLARCAVDPGPPNAALDAALAGLERAPSLAALLGATRS